MQGSLSEISDDALVAEVIKGNRLAFNSIFERYWDKLFQTAFGFLRDEDAAKDVVQEVFFDLWNRREQLDIERLPAYLYQATRFQSLKQLRKAHILDIHDEKFAEVLCANTTEEQVDLNLLQENLEKSLGALPERYREVFELSRVHNLSNKEIADRMNLSPRTID